MPSEAPSDLGFRVRDRLIGRRADDDPVIRLEIYGIVILSFSLVLMLALLSFDPADVSPTGGTRFQPAENVIGPIGAHIADVFLTLLGLGAFAVASVFALLGMSYLVGRHWSIRRAEVLGWMGLVVGGAVILHVGMAPDKMFGHAPGGMVGEYIGEVACAFLSTTGTLIVALTAAVVSLITVTRRSVFELATVVARVSQAAWRGTLTLLEQGRESVGRLRRDGPVGEPDDEHQGGDSPDDPAPDGPTIVEGPSMEPPDYIELDSMDIVEVEELAPNVDPVPTHHEGATPRDEPEEDDRDILIVESAAMRKSRDLVIGEQLALPDEEIPVQYELPSLTLLDYRAPDGHAYEREQLTEHARVLEKTLADYRVKGTVTEIHPGPVITMYEFKPAPGVKISSIANLADDLAMAMSAMRVRIVAPIPGKDVVGIEVPNEAREIVWLKEILADGAYAKAKSKLTLAVGKDIVGNPTVMDLAKAPHLLVAGATNSGKSVAVNSFICSLLYQATPAEVRLIMIDPKMLELSIYEGIPHLLLPVVTDPKQAAVALRWAVREMERRYRLMADMGVRNLASYNEKIETLDPDAPSRLPEKLRMARGRRAQQGMPDPDGVLLDSAGEPLLPLPQLVVIVDELADLMMVAGKDVELAIARLAQMARASGIHLILATQRPSVDVITGLIKANFPSRVSFRVSSAIDSRTILDQKGADKLLGMGDMLWLAPGASGLKRVHGCFVSDDEVHRIVKHLKTQGQPEYDLQILASEEDESDLPGRSGDGDYDEFYDQAVRIVAETRNASISFLQRKLKIGYNRAARIVETLEDEGIIGPADGTSRPREVFIDSM